jgi:hypothetical protein
VWVALRRLDSSRIDRAARTGQSTSGCVHHYKPPDCDHARGEYDPSDFIFSSARHRQF